MQLSRQRKMGGATLAETAASFVIMIPLIMTVLFVVLECSQAFLIKESLAQGARQAARDLAVVYGKNPAVASDRSLQDAMVFNNIRVTNIINASAQFATPTFNTAGLPPTVTVTVSYTSGQNGLPVFPNPDPLRLGNSFQLNATSTYRLE